MKIDTIKYLRTIDELISKHLWNEALNTALHLRNNAGSNFYHELTLSRLSAPNAILAGPARTATTWLRGVLGKHPNVRSAQGEPNFLFNIESGNLSYALSQYFRNDVWRGSPKENEIRCDKSPSYICLSDNSLRLLNALLPDLRIVFGLRDEVTRLWSVIHHRMNDLEFNGDWRSFCESNVREVSHHVCAGQIEFHIERWSAIVGKRNIVVVPHELLQVNPRAAVNIVLQHIGVRTCDELEDHERAGLERRMLSAEIKRKVGNPPYDLLTQVRDIISSRN